jgi:hypothetical protein
MKVQKFKSKIVDENGTKWELATLAQKNKIPIKFHFDLLSNRFIFPHRRNPTLAKCGGEAQHLEKTRIWSPPGLLKV